MNTLRVRLGASEWQTNTERQMAGMVFYITQTMVDVFDRVGIYEWTGCARTMCIANNIMILHDKWNARRMTSGSPFCNTASRNALRNCTLSRIASMRTCGCRNRPNAKFVSLYTRMIHHSTLLAFVANCFYAYTKYESYAMQHECISSPSPPIWK